MASHVSLTRNGEIDLCLRTIWDKIPNLEGKLTNTVIEALIFYSGGSMPPTAFAPSMPIEADVSKPDDDDWDIEPEPVVDFDSFEAPPDDDNDDEW